MDPLGDPLRRARSAPIFERGPLSRAFAFVPGGRSAQGGLERQALGLALIAWVPLWVASFAHDGFRYGAATANLLTDFGAHARCLVAIPLLVMADRICGSRLTAIARNFVDAGMVAESDRQRFDSLVASTRRRSESVLAALVIVVCTYGLLAALLAVLPAEEIPRWHRGAEPRAPSLPGWWHLVVSAALLLALLLAWLWRLLVWTHFLWRMARLPIRLCAAHPDRSGGLKFVGYSVRAFGPVGAALGAMLAGRVANRVWHTGAKLEGFEFAAGGLVVGVLLLFGAPLFAFTLRLLSEWRQGLSTYGTLAGQLGFRFEDKWFRPGQRVEPGALEASDFSAAIDLSSYVATVYEMRLAPGDLKSFIVLAVATALPLLPVVLVAAPFEALVKSIGGLFF